MEVRALFSVGSLVALYLSFRIDLKVQEEMVAFSCPS